MERGRDDGNIVLMLHWARATARLERNRGNVVEILLPTKAYMINVQPRYRFVLEDTYTLSRTTSLKCLLYIAIIIVVF